jgi:RHS repeat-associated protein
LIAVTNNSGVGPNYGLKFAYDPQGRRIQKMVSTNGVGIYTNKFLYDGWNLIAELKPDNSRLRTYVWGTDLSGSLQGAGGVGGLLEVSYYGAATTNCFPAYDGNGNVMNYVNAADGASVAQFEYDPFLGITRATGPMANLLPFLGSTKYFDWESGLYDYGHRYYGPSFGGWLNKDPLQEKGGLNLYENSRNDLVNRYDALGLLPGFHACTLSSDPPVDTGWQYAGFEPDEDIPAGGSSGTSETTGANLVYKRTITTKYSCCCSRTKYRVQIYGSAYDWIPFQNFILWQGVPGAWPPISGLEDPISAFILDKLTSPIPVNPSASDINNQASSHTPSNSTTGTLAKDSGVPTAWCFW